MLHEFITKNCGEIIARARIKVSQRRVPRPTDAELTNGVPLFLDQLVEILRLSPPAQAALGKSAVLHGGDLLRMGFTVGQVVHDYGDICQVVTEIAMEQNSLITTDEFQTFNRCLDEAIAQAVTEFERQREQRFSERETERMGFLAHELRNQLSSASLSFEALKRGTVAIGGSTGAVLERSLANLRDLVNRSLAELRLEAGMQTRERIVMAEFIEEVWVSASMDAKHRDLLTCSQKTGPEELKEMPFFLGFLSEQTFYAWKRKYAGLGIAELRRPKQLEQENRKLKQLVADLMMDFGKRGAQVARAFRGL